MKLIPIIALTTTCMILFGACASDSNAQPVASSPSPVAVAAQKGFGAITPAEAKQRLENEQGVVLLDVRTQEEYDGGHIRGSVLLPLDELATKAAKALPDKDATIFVYCRSGRRSEIAAGQLVNMGYTQVYDLGGIIDWPYEVVKE